jgi:hypothetical protein
MTFWNLASNAKNLLDSFNDLNVQVTSSKNQIDNIQFYFFDGFYSFCSI